MKLIPMPDYAYNTSPLSGTGVVDPEASLHTHNDNVVSERPFAGRLGGNQVFTVSESSEKGRKILEKQPDAVRTVCISCM